MIGVEYLDCILSVAKLKRGQEMEALLCFTLSPFHHRTGAYKCYGLNVCVLQNLNADTLILNVMWTWGICEIIRFG